MPAGLRAAITGADYSPVGLPKEIIDAIMCCGAQNKTGQLILAALSLIKSMRCFKEQQRPELGVLFDLAQRRTLRVDLRQDFCSLRQ